MLPGSLPTLLRQEYPGDLGFVLVDDQSGDGTESERAQIPERIQTARA